MKKGPNGVFRGTNGILHLINHGLVTPFFDCIPFATAAKDDVVASFFNFGLYCDGGGRGGLLREEGLRTLFTESSTAFTILLAILIASCVLLNRYGNNEVCNDINHLMI